MSDREGVVEPTHYAYRVVWSVEDAAFVATCSEFPSLSWVAKTQVKALHGLEALLREVLADLAASGEDAPIPLAERHYSGKFNLRIGESLHRQLAMEAAAEALSLNQYVVRKLTPTPPPLRH